MAWAILWKPLKPSRTTRRLSTWANTSSLLRPAFCSKPASRPCCSLPSGLPAVRAGRTGDAPPLDAVPGGDLLLAVEAVRPVLVVLFEVLGSQFQAVGAAGHRGGVVGVDGVHAVVAAQRVVARGVVDYGIVFVRHVITLIVRAHQQVAGGKGGTGTRLWGVPAVD